MRPLVVVAPLLNLAASCTSCRDPVYIDQFSLASSYSSGGLSGKLSVVDLTYLCVGLEDQQVGSRAGW